MYNLIPHCGCSSCQDFLNEWNKLLQYGASEYNFQVTSDNETKNITKIEYAETALIKSE